MNQKNPASPPYYQKKSIFSGGLGLKLVFWFLLLSIVPMSVLSYLNYRNSYETIMKNISDSFNERIDSNTKIIQAHFNRFDKDLMAQSTNSQNILFLEKLKQAFEKSSKPLKDFVKSNEWKKLTASDSHELIDFKKNYGYYDLLMLDTEGNVLYSIAQEGDLGENLFTGRLASTLLAKACRKVLKEGKAVFSDIEFYEPSDMLSSFWVTTITDHSGKKEGIMVLQLDMDTLTHILDKNNYNQKTEENYIIGEDLILRVSSNPSDQKSLLKKRVDNLETRKWLKEVSSGKKILGPHKHADFYKKSNGKAVIGIHRTINVGGKKFAIITEIDETEGLERVFAIRDSSIFMVVFTGIIVTLISLTITGNIVRPILIISNVAKDIAAGNLQNDVRIKLKNEIGDLAHYINLMLLSLRNNAEKNQQNNWFQTGQNKLNRLTLGNLKTGLVCLKAINFVSKYINAKVGAIYLINQESPDYMDFMGGFAVSAKTIKSERIKIGEGIIGQTAQDMTPICLDEVPEDYLKISSALGDMSPKHITVIPCIYQDKIIAVMEFGTIGALTEFEMQFLEAVAKIVAVEINSAISRANKAMLLKSVQDQAEELQAQQEELRTANEELEEQAKELQSQQEELRAANEELEGKTEELQSQQEELRTTNEELSEKANTLETQKIAILQQNVDLEEARSALTKKAEELEITSKYKSEFLANMSHELRTPLNSILLLSDDLKKNKDKHLDGEELEAAEIINKSGSELLLLINDILNLSKIEAGKMSVEILDVKLQSFIDDLRMQFARLMKEKDLSFEISINKTIPETIKTDPLKLGQIVKNIISNAIKFTKSGGIFVNIGRPDESSNIHLSGFDPDHTIAISIKDTGIGIPKDKQKIIFEAFQQADGSTSRQYGGTGLGLSISRELSKLLGGIIELESKEYEGTVVTLYIPEELQQNETDPEDKTASSSRWGKKANTAKTKTIPSKTHFDIKQVQQSSQTDGTKAVIIIDKDPDFVKSFCKQCEEHDLTPIIADTVSDSVEIVNSRPVSAIILNLDIVSRNELIQFKPLQDSPKTKNIPIHVISHSDESGEPISCGLDASKELISVEKLNAAFGNIVEDFIQEPGKTILVIEDNEIQAKAISKLIGDVGAEIIVAGTGSEAIDILKSKPVACVILDLGLPDMPGLALLEKLDKMKGIDTPPTIIYTGKELSDYELDSLYKYSNSIIIKGVKSAEILLQETQEFLVRVAQKEPDEEQQEAPEQSGLDSLMEGKKVLVVDDDMRNVFAMSRVLSDKGMEVVKAEDGKKAISILEKQDDIDIVLMDIMMPNMNGYEAMQEIRCSDSKVKKHDIIIIAVTAKAMKEDRQKCLDAGADDYLIKPVIAEKLFSIIKIWLKKSKGNS